MAKKTPAVKTDNSKNEYYASSRAAWRNWLAKNHVAAGNIWLVIYKKDSGVPTLTYEESVEEALCFGWIDSKPNKRDDKSYWLFFAERKPKSVWSKLNKTRIASLLKQGLMKDAGLAKIEAAKKDGSWIALDEIEEYKMPPALEQAFKKNKKALSNFEAFPPGVKKQIYQWIISAKTDTTLTKRVTETVEKAALNIRANQWQPKK
jgi:uncharacterized protein YdeI (YjbR/CyaY-like superfamily)